MIADDVAPSLSFDDFALMEEIINNKAAEVEDEKGAGEG